MIAALLLLVAAEAAPPPPVRLQAVATARILAGERIGFEAEAAVPSAQRTVRIRRAAAGEQPRQFRLVEFQ
jgi:hypothetical protein